MYSGRGMESLSIIIPVKDEEDGLNYLLDDYRKSVLYGDVNISFIFVIDGRTSDQSRNIAYEFSDVIIDQKSTHGKGSAVREAVKLWKDSQSKYVIFMDADGSYSFSDVSKILFGLKEGNDVVSGSRFLSKKGKPKGMGYLHNFGNIILSYISSIKNRRRITDLCTGLWGFTADALIKLNLNAKGFDLEAEIAGKIRKNDLVHNEVAVNWSARKGGNSKLKSFKDGSIILFRILRT
jgi:dolichol-phosphate hexosyltransferase